MKRTYETEKVMHGSLNKSLMFHVLVQFFLNSLLPKNHPTFFLFKNVFNLA